MLMLPLDSDPLLSSLQGMDKVIEHFLKAASQGKNLLTTLFIIICKLNW